MATEAKVIFYGGATLAEDDRIETALDAATAQLGNAATWGDRFDDAVACLAAHMLLINPQGPDCVGGDGMTRGQLTSEKSGSESTNYRPLTAASLGDQDLARANAGVTFLRMRSSLVGIGPAVLC